jgi:hypothetical protein
MKSLALLVGSFCLFGLIWFGLVFFFFFFFFFLFFGVFVDTIGPIETPTEIFLIYLYFFIKINKCCNLIGTDVAPNEICQNF